MTGTGLGLKIVKDIITGYGGLIYVKNQMKVIVQLLELNYHMIKRDIKMTYKYLYIDDEEKCQKPFAQQLSDQNIQVDTKHVSEIELSDTKEIIRLINTMMDYYQI